MKNSALVVIDLQNDITKHYREIIDPVNAAIDWAVQKELWVIYIQHNNLSAGTRTFKPGTRGAELVSELNVVSGHIFTKSKRTGLPSEAFAAFIQEHGISEFYIVGADAASASCRSDPAHGRIYPDPDTDASAEYGAGVTHASWTARAYRNSTSASGRTSLPTPAGAWAWPRTELWRSRRSSRSMAHPSITRMT